VSQAIRQGQLPFHRIAEVSTDDGIG
jgi:hypothetical protein